MRYIFQGTFRDGQGNIVDDGEVYVYESGTDTPCTIYEEDSGGSSVSHVHSDSSGYFCFYVDNTEYNTDQLFKLKLYKDGYTNQFYDNVSIFPFGINIKYGSESVADGGYVTHGLGEEPTWILVTATESGEFVSVTAKSSTTFTLAIKKYDNSAGTTQTIYWQAGV